MNRWTFVMLVIALFVAALPAAAIDPNCTADIFTNGVVDAIDVLVVATDMGCVVGGGITCPGDVNGNGVVGSLDLARVIANLGDCPCVGDVDLSGSVDAADVTETVAAIFSYCPDIDGNGVVDANDEFIVLASYTSAPDVDAVPEADLDGDGDVDGDDYTIVSSNTGLNCRTDVNFSLVVEVVDAAIVGAATCP